MIWQNGIDGLSPRADYRAQNCVNNALCTISEEELACSFQSLLPQGPLWQPAAPAPGSCTSMAAFARFCGQRLYDTISAIIWPSLREMSPYTAAASLDEWLDRLGWQDCYDNSCLRRHKGLSPLEVMVQDCPQYCAPHYSADYAGALKLGIVIALWRLRLGIAPNLAALNFILSSLSAELVPDTKGADLTAPCNNKQLCLILRSTGAPMPVPAADCATGGKTVPALFDGEIDCGAETGILERRFYAGVMAADCIARSVIYSPKLCIEPQFYEVSNG